MLTNDLVPLITVIVPVYKVEPYLRKCVDSILAQTYTNLEIILIDDGSPDNCPAICDDYAALDSRVKVIHQPNAGVSAARNAGLDAATGEYIGFVDSDDWIEPDMYEVLYSYLIHYGADLSCIAQCTDSRSHLQQMDHNFPVRQFDNVGAINELLSPLGMTSSVWSKLFAAKLFKTEKFDSSLAIGEDTLICIKLLSKAEKIIYIDHGCYHYLQRNSSAMHTFNDKYWSRLTAVSNIYNFLKHSLPTCLPRSKARCISSALELSIFAADSGQLTRENYKRIFMFIQSYLSKDSFRLLSSNFKFWLMLFKSGRLSFIFGRKIRAFLLDK